MTTQPGEKGRVDGAGRAYAGSQLQIQIFVNRHADELSQCLLEALPSLAEGNPRIRWVSPLESDGFVEYQDEAFLSAVGYGHATESLYEFWPKGGPSWDALGIADLGGDAGNTGIIMVEAKSHPPEVYGKGCRASRRSRAKIESALLETKRWLGVREDADWTGPLYQCANRLAHLYFFTQTMGVPAWLSNVYFVSDPYLPTSVDEWRVALRQVKEEMGLSDITVPHAANVFLDAKDRRELVGR
jgi:hypothetical protein